MKGRASCFQMYLTAMLLYYLMQIGGLQRDGSCGTSIGSQRDLCWNLQGMMRCSLLSSYELENVIMVFILWAFGFLLAKDKEYNFDVSSFSCLIQHQNCWTSALPQRTQSTINAGVPCSICLSLSSRCAFICT